MADIPRAIEVLIKKASVDPEFRQLLLEKREQAAGEIDLADPVIIPSLIMELLQLSGELHRSGPASSQVLHKRLQVGLFAGAGYDFHLDLGLLQALMGN